MNIRKFILFKFIQLIAWIDNLIGRNIIDINVVTESLEVINNKTESDNSLNTSDELNKIVYYLMKLQNFIDSGEKFLKFLEFSMALKITNDFLNAYNNIINQNNAWINTTVDQKIKIASQLLLYVQKCSYISRLFINDTNEITEFKNQNI